MNLLSESLYLSRRASISCSQAAKIDHQLYNFPDHPTAKAHPECHNNQLSYLYTKYPEEFFPYGINLDYIQNQLDTILSAERQLS